MPITHEEARKLIQFNADEALNAQEKITLSTHIKDCIECRAYAEEIKEVVNILLPMMKRHWALQPLPLLTGAIYAKRSPKTRTIAMLATRITAISAVLLIFIFSAWQFALSGGQKSGQVPVGILPVPTPSAQSTSTEITPENCDERRYIVQENDTLESIAQQFAASKEEIIAINRLNTEAVHKTMELRIPICNFTPTGTIHPTTYSTSNTPSTSPTTSTPGG